MKTIDQIAGVVMAIFILWTLSALGVLGQVMGNMSGFFGDAHGNVNVPLAHDLASNFQSAIESAHDSFSSTVQNYMSQI